MTKQDFVELVNRLLVRKHNDHHKQLIYERGFLTGILVRLMYDDSNIAHKVIKILKQHKSGREWGIRTLGASFC